MADVTSRLGRTMQRAIDLQVRQFAHLDATDQTQQVKVDFAARCTALVSRLMRDAILRLTCN